ncbi:hypothetical protein [Sorangium sp. So ce388]|uniref:hypothetical protein n=1 Tax=Sorangium sp. So ce388 TaxID=3133309 RepID=UPI003F5C7F4B
MCGRSAGGLSCALSNGSTCNPYSFWTSDYGDPGGSGSAEFYWGTLGYPDLDRDGKQEVCGRASGGFFCAR